MNFYVTEVSEFFSEYLERFGEILVISKVARIERSLPHVDLRKSSVTLRKSSWGFKDESLLSGKALRKEYPT